MSSPAPFVPPRETRFPQVTGWPVRYEMAHGSQSTITGEAGEGEGTGLVRSMPWSKGGL